MSIYSFFSFIGAIICIYLIVKTLIKDPKNNLNLMFSILCFSLFLISFFIGIGYSLKAREDALFILKFAFIGVYFSIALNLHFFFILTKAKNVIWILFLNYLPSIIFTLVNFFRVTTYSDLIKYNGEWVLVTANSSIWSYLYYFYTLFYLFICSIIIIKWGKRSRLRKDKIYSNFLLFSTDFSIYHKHNNDFYTSNL